MVQDVRSSITTQRAVIGYQDWREMVFVHWPVAPSVLRSMIPPTLEIDRYDGDAWVSLLPFAVERARPRLVPPALGMDFFEVNLRTYVIHRGQPGIWFFSLDAGSRFAVKAARLLYGLPYVYARIDQRRERDRLTWRCEREGGGRMAMTVDLGDARGTAAPGSLDHFLLERHTLFVQRKTALVRQSIAHPPYPVRDAQLAILSEDLLAAAGVREAAKGPPVVHASPGVDVRFFLPDVVEQAPVGADLGRRTPVR